MTKVAIIPARGGSKRIPRKNIKPFRDKPIIAYSIETAHSTGLFDMVMVSTDDEEIAEIAKSHGAKVPFYRSKDTSGDFSTTAEVMLEVIYRLQETYNDLSHVCCIYPTAPLLSKESLVQGFELLEANKYISVLPVTAFSFPIFRSLKFGENNSIEMFWPENMHKRSQDLPMAYHDAGQFYWLEVNGFVKEPKLYTSHSGAIVLDHLQVQDIDNEADWKIAEIKYDLLFSV